MRIPLDYYRILGLPLAASDEQLQQAYSDRVVQLPRREYSEAAITSRKKLIEEAYVVLSNPKERKAYDQLYLAHAYGGTDGVDATVAVENRIEADIDAQILTIEISHEELIGALLLLQELGEYELVLRLGRPYLVNKNGTVLKHNRQVNVESNYTTATATDIFLTVALACLELGREQWQQGNYENAAISLETGEELLAREGLFPNVRAEILSDLYRLRPYRILELLALPEENTKERAQGLQLLQEILEERGGIDGTGNDQTGLTIDDFLRFIQQLRNYLTVAEQHKLFEAESKRPSAVATYLAVYAAIARGFTQSQPALIRTAKQMLIRLGKRQDVHLEQSLCALLLGQTEEASRVLELSQEYEALAFIRENSQDSPDLLPGLCLYAESWLQNEVFPHFRDLVQTKASLREYFADSQVQAYLDALPTEAVATNESIQINHQSSTHTQTNYSQRRSSGTTVSRPLNSSGNSNIPETPTRTRPEYSHTSSPKYATSNSRQANSSKVESPVVTNGRVTNHNSNSVGTKQSVPPRRRRKRTYVDEKRIGFVRNPQAYKKLGWIVIASTAGVLVLWLSITTTVGLVKNLFFSTSSRLGDGLAIQLNEPPIQIPDSNSKLQISAAPITETTAEEIVQSWLVLKAAALGRNHDIDSLAQILTDPALTQWRQIAQADKAENRYRRYEHSLLKLESVETSELEPNRGAIEATVREVAEFYKNGQVSQQKPYTVKVRYELTRANGGWRIQSMSVLNEVNQTPPGQ
ncbi:IMS domain-containing protein [Iningainema tapete]|uniref:DUF4101 domain-containing protein n=1 Tax=Iningainema tapete BLCC-T55 TaxID=2748662 RepID=A0A8J7CBC1_9CYAN|nr:DUF4101 domain-containing protein [Iningainema tapete BLCC-T55]